MTMNNMDKWTPIDEGIPFDWDTEIQKDGPEFTMLPAGEYPFEVTKFERSRFEGSQKLPPCPMALLTIAIDGGEKGKTVVTHRLYLHSRCEGLLCAFFESIGQRQHGAALRPRWNEVVGSKGLCRLGIHEYTKKDGTPGRNNEISRFLPPAEPKAAPVATWTQGHF